jgi:CDP-6-deoxy-D-xylo-4-hexulose-3-dehydrase
MKTTFTHERETLTALSDWLATCPERLSMGEYCATFEREFAAWQGRKYAVLFNSGGSANLALWQALLNGNYVKPGARVGFSALTWATNVMPLLQLGLKTIPIDVDPCTLNINSQGPLFHVDALFVTNALGYLPDLAHLRGRCADAGILLIEDNCESLGSAVATGKAGNFSHASTFSFFVAHTMSTIEGGMVCTDDDTLDELLRMVRANGWDRNLSAPQKAKWRAKYSVTDEFDAKYTFYVNGFNLRPTEITGFLGLEQLKHLDDAIDLRIRRFETLEHVARQNADFEVLEHSHMTRLAPFAFPVLCKTKDLRDKYVSRFGGAGVEIRPVIAGNIVRQPFYQPYSDYPDWPLPGADRVSQCGFYFGIYPELTPADMETLKSCLGGW